MSSAHFLANKTQTVPLGQERVKSPKGNKTNHFSTKSTRFSDGFFKAKEGPGPGEYSSKASETNKEVGILTNAQKSKKGKEWSVFRSTTNRFHEPNPAQKLQNSNSQYADLDIYNVKRPNTISHPKSMMPYAVGVGFSATSPRFPYNRGFHGQNFKNVYPNEPNYDSEFDNMGSEVKDLKRLAQKTDKRRGKIKQNYPIKRYYDHDTPGPGDYNPSDKRPKSFSHSFGAGRRQFGSYVSGKGTNNGVGPGSYISTDCIMIKKSYAIRG